MTELAVPEGSGGKGSWILKERPQPGSGVRALILALSLAQHISGASDLHLLGRSFLYSKMGTIDPPFTGWLGGGK